MNPFEIFAGTGKLQRQLRAMRAGDSLTVSAQRLVDCALPVHPLERLTEDEQIEWFRSRLPFLCCVHRDLLKDSWTFKRQPPGQWKRWGATE